MSGNPNQLLFKTNQLAYDPENIFAKIIDGKIPSHKIFETDEVLAKHRWPQSAAMVFELFSMQ